eukprot:scaffold2045_cov79-Skeletonema_marinoi.AAC.2
MGASDNFELALRISDPVETGRRHRISVHEKADDMPMMGVHGGKGCASSDEEKRCGEGKKTKVRPDD